MNVEKNIFKKGSTTYYFSSRFFPKKIRGDVFRLYSFVRVADDYIDAVPAQPKKFRALRLSWDKAKKDSNFFVQSAVDDSIDERVLKNMVQLTRKYGFDVDWIDSFLDAMQSDLDKKLYLTLNDTLEYMHGSAEVIGLMMAKIMGLPNVAEETAQLQGRAMQFVNFIRDIAEDNQLGRCYFPQEDLKKFGLPDLRQATVTAYPENFQQFINFQLDRYYKWQAEAAEGFRYIPARLRVPLETAVDMYNWTAEQIHTDPFIIYKRKIKPRKRRVLSRAGGKLFKIKL